jgi:hypothetical protein
MPALDAVTQRFIADVRPYLEAMHDLIKETGIAAAAVQDLIKRIEKIPAVKRVRIVVDTAGGVGDTGLGTVPAQAEAAAHAVQGLAVAWTEEAVAQKAADAAAAAFGRDVTRAAAGVEELRIRIEDAIAAQDGYNYSVLQARIANAEYNRTLIDAAHAGFASAEVIQRLGPAFLVSAAAAKEAGGAVRGVAAAASTAGAAAGRAWRPWWLLGNTWKTALHWIVAGAAEVLAVAVPALVALGSGALVAFQGAQNLQRHFTALYAATESTASAFHTTTGDVLGLGHALQTAQDKANPGVYELLGSVINDAKTRFADFAATGLDVVHMLDQFAARVTVDLKGTLGAQLHAFLGSMVQDLQQIGQVLGNFGHALINAFAAMPGLVRILLGTVDALSQFALWLSKAPAGLLTFGIAMEEVFRWGGLLLGVFARLAGAGALMNTFAAGGGFITRFGAAIKALVVQGGVAIMWVGQMVGKLSLLGPAAAEAGAAVETLGADIAIAGATMSTGLVVGIVAAAAALTFLIVKLASAKSATQQWVAASDQMVAKASDLNVLPTIYGQLAATATRLGSSINATNNAVAHQSAVVTAAGTSWRTMNDSTHQAMGNNQVLASHLLSLVATANTVRGNINLLAGTFHTSAIGALALANAAGVNLQVGLTKGSVAAKTAVQQINNLKAGLGAMAAPAGVVGADMEAVGIQSQLAASKVGQVNQSLDQFVGTLTGGINGVAQFDAALHSMGHDTLSRSVSLTGAINSISRSAAHMGFTLQGMGVKAQQSWQQFGQAVNTGQQVLDTFRTGMAEGVVSAGQYNRAIMDVAGSLLPFAAHSKTATAIVSALAQQAGLPATHNFKTLATQLGITGRAAQNQLAAGMQAAIVKMSSMSLVARNLSATVSGQLDAAMAGAIVKASGLDQAYSKWATDVKSNSAPKTLAGDLRAIQTAQNFVNTAEAKGTTLLNNNAKAAGNLGSAVKGAAGEMGNFSGKTRDVHAALNDVIARARGAGSATQGYGQQAHAAAGTSQGLASNARQATTSVHALGTAAGVTRGSLGTVNNEIRTTASVAGAARGPLGTMSNEISNVGSNAAGAAGEVRSLASAIASLQSKTITVTTNVVTVASTIHRQHGGPVAAGVPYTVGEAGRELFVPTVPGFILPSPVTKQILTPIASPTAAAAGGGPAQAVIHNHVYLDGQELWHNQQQVTLRYNARNGNRGAGTVAPTAPIG